MSLRRVPWRIFWTRYVAALGLASVLTLVGVVGVNVLVATKLARIPRVKNLRLTSGPAHGGNFLVIGSDSRQFEDQAGAAERKVQQQQFGSAQTQTGQRSDTIMILHVEPDQKRTVLVSIPRDTLVDIPGMGRTKINAAFNSGPQLLIDTIEKSLDIPINHYIEVNFIAFRDIVNAIGTVPLYFGAPTRDTWTGLNITTAGCHRLNGAQALDYVRSRHMEVFQDGRWHNASPRADLDRIARQQGFIRKLADVAYRRAVGNPLTANAIADKVVGELHVDSGLSSGDILRLVDTFRRVNPSQPGGLQTTTLPTDRYVTASIDALTVSYPAADAVLTGLRSFDVSKSPPASKTKPSSVSVQVLNGTSTAGQASRTLDALAGFGFVRSGTGNASATTHTEVRIAPGAEAKAELVKSYLGGVGTIVTESSQTGADVVVVVGSDFSGRVAAPGGADASASSGSGGASTTSTTLDAAGRALQAAEAAC